MNNEKVEHRRHLVSAAQKAQDDYDKTVISLSGGALAISFAFLDKLTDGPPFDYQWVLFLAWGSWAISMAVMLFSFFASEQALRRAIHEVDEGKESTAPGGRWASATKWLNAIGGFLFIVGLVSLGCFMGSNFGDTTGPGGPE